MGWRVPRNVAAEIAGIAQWRNLVRAARPRHDRPPTRKRYMTDLVLAIAHHLCVFTLAGLLIAEVALLRPGMTGERLNQLGRVDLAYGILAGLVIVVGIVRVNFGDKGADYYIHSIAFWLKMASFLAVGLLSLPPTLSFLRWRRQFAAEPGFVPAAAEIARARMFFLAEIVGFALILVFAAAMARGYGTF
jgi:putative membrane protein